MVRQNDRIFQLTPFFGIDVGGTLSTGTGVVLYTLRRGRGPTTVEPSVDDRIGLINPNIAQSIKGVTGENVTVTFNGGSPDGTVSFVETTDSPSSFYNHTDAEAQGPWNDYLKQDYATFAIVHKTDTDDYYLFFSYDKGLTGNKNNATVTESWDGLSGSVKVEDDPPFGDDSYNTSFPTATVHHDWGGTNTDGWAVGPLSSGDNTITYSVTDSSGDLPTYIRAVGNDLEEVTESFGPSATAKLEFSI